MLAAAFSPRITPGDPLKNVEPVTQALRRAHDAGAALLLLPALCLTGASCGDLFGQRVLREAAEAALAAVVRESAALPGLTAVLGVPLRRGDALYSCAAFLREGRLLAVAPLPCGEERRFAPPPREPGTLSLPGLGDAAFDAGAVVACGALRVSTAPGGDVLLLPALHAADADSVERLDDQLRRRSAAGISCVMACPGRGESVTDRVYTGYAALAAEGRLLGSAEGEMVLSALAPATRQPSELPAPREPLNARTPLFPFDEADSARRCARILALQTQALAARLEKIGMARLVLGVSGGLDSTLALLACAGALDALGLPRHNLLAVTMPCFGTSARTRSNAEILARSLGAEFREIPIGESVALHLRQIGHDETRHDTVYENAQARERTQVLMDLGNAVGGIVVGTGDMSELALGWCTYNGDHMSMYAVNAGVPKTAVRRVVAHYADTCADPALAAALRAVLATPVSPELLPGKDGAIAQLTEDLIGPYELHDFFLCRFLARGESPEELLGAAQAAFASDYAPQTVEKWLRVFLRRFFSQQFKRSCSPDGPAVLAFSLSPRGGWQMPSDISGAAWLRRLP